MSSFTHASIQAQSINALSQQPSCFSLVKEHDRKLPVYLIHKPCFAGWLRFPQTSGVDVIIFAD